ncbi:unnamed protein product [Cylindrotheca closterium]|uniref:DUF6824 domain-containing protein n=1 Tax=Cylindrotheca closterium TaxID=2856 RepID=A0AAD2CY34_9STRA|nr:unnamed protein product [Cylindrotheca closterium]
MEGLQSARNEDIDSGYQCGEEGGSIPQHQTPSSNIGSDKGQQQQGGKKRDHKSSSRELDSVRNQGAAKGTTELRDDDIAFGRGHFSQNHEGNIRMRKIVEKYKIQYQNLRRPLKRELLQIVYREITENGARFLRRNEENKWEVAGKSNALKKVNQTLQSKKRVDSPSLFLSEPTSRVMPRSIVAPHSLESSLRPRSNLMSMPQHPTIPRNLLLGAQDLGQGIGHGMFLCDPAGFVPQPYALSSQIDYHLLQQERNRQQQLRLHCAISLLQQTRAATNAVSCQLASQRVPTRQADKQPITRSDTQGGKEQTTKKRP